MPADAIGGPFTERSNGRLVGGVQRWSRRPVLFGVGAAEMQRPAGWGAVAGVGAADHARRHGLVEPPAIAVGARGIRDMRDMRVCAGGPCRGWGLAFRDIRDITRRCRGCRGYRFTIRDRLAARLTSGFVVWSRMSRMSRQIARPGLVEVGAGVALALGTGAVLADILRPGAIGMQQLGQLAGGERAPVPVRPWGV